MIELILPGTGGTVPRKDRWLASAILRHNGQNILIDCGEGTQIAIKESGVAMTNMLALCITHYHADHCSGLPGFLLTLGNEGRKDPLYLIGPAGLEAVLRGLLVIAPLSYELRLIEISEEKLALSKEPIEIGDFRITPFPLDHGIPCYGYKFEIPRSGKFDPEKARANGVPLPIWSRLQKEEEAEYGGKVYQSDLVLGPDRKGLKLVYATDTRPTPAIVREAWDADLLVCEGMFGDEEKDARAREAGHMLFSNAAAIAREAGASRLVLTHYSACMKTPEDYLENATHIFPNTVCGYDGYREILKFEE